MIKKDGFATRGISKGFYCDYEKQDTVDKEEPKAIVDSPGMGSFAASNTYGWDDSSRFKLRLDQSIDVSEWTNQLVFGIDDETIVYDGTSRRGYMLFKISSDDKDKSLEPRV